MEAGYELDKAVADAIGHCFEETTDCVWESGEKPHGSHWNFHPSTDVNDAIRAGQKKKMFGYGGCCISFDDKTNEWVVGDTDDVFCMPGEVKSRHASLAMAICMELLGAECQQSS